MLEMMLDKYVIYALMGGAAACGIISKLIASITLKRLVKASGSMNKSTHPLMRLVRARFEHACMVSEKVENVRVFVDKYLYEYRVAGLKLHSLRRLEYAASWVCLILGLAGAAFSYIQYGMREDVLRLGASGAGLAILVFLVHLTTDEGYRMEVIRNYMVDYLENICLHRYGKASQKELKVMAPEVPVPDFGEAAAEDELMEELPEMDEPVRPRLGQEIPQPEITPPVMPEPYDVPGTSPQIRAVKPRREETGSDGEKTIRPVKVSEEARPVRASKFRKGAAGSTPGSKSQDAADILAAAVKASGSGQDEKTRQRKEKMQEPAKEVLIRQILEEFMA